MRKKTYETLAFRIGAVEQQREMVLKLNEITNDGWLITGGWFGHVNSRGDLLIFYLEKDETDEAHDEG